ncbi:conserved hypothetical protein [Hahella chejuensis KCTC 2396]|uniref:Solute-binding protein family 3/N-terminal domain-containing protein n=1 Tax=Hahella chejuensis (strain KCTC 2396) TaxID=349521 RepID=Q2SGW7_HAHCH|nr:hypothetical protein [Hahella chejuensis]ABC30107.1 conserved hypothetical protein [Hahella chejuensis KCTC 2396]
MQYKCIACLMALLAPLYTSFNFCWANEKKLVLAVSSQLSQSPQIEVYTNFYSEAFRRIGYGLELKVFPSERSGALANSGYVDGLPGRVKDYNSHYRDLIRVDVPLWTMEFVAYSNVALRLDVFGWEALAKSIYRVDCRIGVIRCVSMLSKPLSNRLELVYSAESALKRLQLRRSDVYVDLATIVDPLLREEKYASMGIKRVGAVELVENYLYLHKKHQALVPNLEVALKNMKEEGWLNGDPPHKD